MFEDTDSQIEATFFLVQSLPMRAVNSGEQPAGAGLTQGEISSGAAAETSCDSSVPAVHSLAFCRLSEVPC